MVCLQRPRGLHLHGLPLHPHGLPLHPHGLHLHPPGLHLRHRGSRYARLQYCCD